MPSETSSRLKTGAAQGGEPFAMPATLPIALPHPPLEVVSPFPPPQAPILASDLPQFAKIGREQKSMGHKVSF